MTYLVFSQGDQELPDTERLASHATRFFGAKLEAIATEGPSVRLRLSSARPSFDAELTIRVRRVTRHDLEDARQAEARGRAAGMATLAERCTRVWELEGGARGEPSEMAFLTLAGICASVALGPVLPSDHSTLFGVRGAFERREKLENSPPP